VPSGPKLEFVRYTVKTKVVTTALKAAEPQSHSPHASTMRLRVLEGPSAPTAVASASVGVIPENCGRSGSMRGTPGSLMSVTLEPFGEQRVHPRAPRRCGFVVRLQGS